MLSLFPTLLAFQFFAPLLLRFAVGFFFVNLGIRHATRDRATAAREMTAITQRFSPISIPASFFFLVVVIEVAVGVLLVAGFLTQAAAIVGGIIAIKYAFFAPRHAPYTIHAQTTYLLVAVICAALLLTGGGALAIDLPL